jgi:inosine-uridine nucleoside N-ribohydrolase
MASRARRRLVLDCDTGSDDAIAIMLAARHPGLDLVGVSTVFGNHPVAETTDHTLRVLAHVGRDDVPVHPGAAEPLAPRPVAPDDRVLPAFALPPAGRSPAAQPAGAWLADTLADGATTLVATGPLTNLARAVSLRPDLARVVDEVVFLGGTSTIPGVTPLAERNVWNDPAALSVVLAAGFRRLVMVTLDATYAAQLDASDARWLGRSGTPAGSAAAGFVEERITQYAGTTAPGSAPVHDPLAVTYLLDPDVVGLERMHVAVDLAAGPAYARTSFSTDGEPNAWVARTADRARYRDLLRATLAG